MSSSAAYDSRPPRQVSEGFKQCHLKDLKKKKSKCSKSSGSIEKSIVCSSCDDGEITDHDAEKRLGSTSEASSTNVLFFKDITDSSNNSVDKSRIPLRPGKRRSVCSKLGIDKRKVKFFKGIEGMDESLENFCEFHKQLRLKTPEKQYNKKRQTSPDFMKYRRESFQKEERPVRIKKPSTAGVVNDIPPDKYPESIFKVFMKPQEKVVKKRVVPVSSEDLRGSKGQRIRPLRKASKTLFEAKVLEKERSPVTFKRLTGKPKENTKATKEEESTLIKDEAGDCRLQKGYDSVVEETVEKVKILAVKKSKSTLKSNDNVKRTSSKRSVHWDDEVRAIKGTEMSSEDTEDTTETWEMQCAKRSNQIRMAYRKIKSSKPSGLSSRKNTTSREKLAASKEKLQKALDSVNTYSCMKNMTNVQYDSTCKDVIVAQFQGEGKLVLPLESGNGIKEYKSDEDVGEQRKANIVKTKRLSSSESEIYGRRGRKYYSETSEEGDLDDVTRNAESKLRKNYRRRKSIRYRSSDTDVSFSSLDDDYKTVDSLSRRSRTSRISEDNLKCRRRTSSPAILKVRDSLSKLVRGKSSPVMDRKSKLEQSKSTLSSLSMVSKSSMMDREDCFERGERSHLEENEQENFRENINALTKTTQQLNSMLKKEKHQKYDQNVDNLKENMKYEKQGDQEAMLCFRECLKQTQDCLEKLKTHLPPAPRDTTQIIQKIRAKLSKIGHQVESNQKESRNSNCKSMSQVLLLSSKPEPMVDEVKKITQLKKQTNHNVKNENLSGSEMNNAVSPVRNSISACAEKSESHPSETKIHSSPSKPISADRPRKKAPQTERSKKILEAWENTKKSIGERSDRLLQTIRTLREKKLTRSRGSDCSSFGRSEEGLSGYNIETDVSRKSKRTISLHERNETDNKSGCNTKNSETEFCNELSKEHKENTSSKNRSDTSVKSSDRNDNHEKIQNISSDSIQMEVEENDESSRKVSNTEEFKEEHNEMNDPLHDKEQDGSFNKDDSLKFTLVEHLVQGSDSEEDHKSQIRSPSKSLSNEMKFSADIQKVGTTKNGSNSEEMYEINKNISNISNNVEEEKFHDVSLGANDYKSNTSIEMANMTMEQQESDLSSQSLEHVTTASIDTDPTDRFMTFNGRNLHSNTSSPDSSRPTSRNRGNTPTGRESPAGSSRTITLERPPSRKPYFERDLTDDESNNRTRVRIRSQQPRSRNTPASVRTNTNNQDTRESKKPPSSRMYSTLKETPFSKKETLKSAIKDLHLSPKPSVKKVTLSSPPTAKSSPRASQHKMSSPQRPSTAKSNKSPTVSSMMSPGSLRILKEKTLRNREQNAKRVNNTSNKVTELSPKSSKTLDGRSNVMEQASSCTSNEKNVVNTVNKSSIRASTPRTPNSSIASTLKGSRLVSSPLKKQDQLRVTFEDDQVRHQEQAEKKNRSFHRLPLSKRLPNYKPPWERVDLRPPENALAERAIHEKRLFVGPKKHSRISQQNSDASRPQTPMSKASELKTSSRGSKGNPASGTTTNSTLTVKTSNVPRHVRLRQRLLRRRLPPKQL